MEIYPVTALMEGWRGKEFVLVFGKISLLLRFPKTMAGWWWMFCSLSDLCVMAHVKRISRRNSAKKSLVIKNKSESVRGMFLIIFILFPLQTASQGGRMAHSLMQMLFPLPVWFLGLSWEQLGSKSWVPLHLWGVRLLWSWVLPLLALVAKAAQLSRAQTTATWKLFKHMLPARVSGKDLS